MRLRREARILGWLVHRCLSTRPSETKAEARVLVLVTEVLALMDCRCSHSSASPPPVLEVIM